MNKIYILHGWAYSKDKWNSLVTKLQGEGFTVKLPDIPGLTKESKKVWTLDNYCEWLNKETSKDKKINLVGHSNGGRIALSFAAKYPQKLDKLILIDSAGIYHKDFYTKVKRYIYKPVAKVGGKVTQSSSVKKYFYKLVGEQDYTKASVTTKQTMINMISTDLTDLLSTIMTPTLIIWGKEDKILSLADGELMNNKIKNSKLIVINKARHSPQFSSPARVSKEIVNFCHE